MTTDEFIKKFADADVHDLALKARSFPEVDMTFALDQISGRKKALKKLPAWAAIEGVVYPPHLSMEQCSSEFTAIYKRNILLRLLGRGYSITDITGGFGVDFMYMSENSSRAVYVERNNVLCKAAQHNSALFGRENVEIVNSDSENYIMSMEHTDVIYADPARRDAAGGRTYAISDCTPDVIQLLPELLDKAKYVVVKLSPMLDHNKTIEDFNKIRRCVNEIHIVSVANECKELLVVMSGDACEEYNVYCINDDDEFVYTPSSDIHLQPLLSQTELFDGLFLYEPNASIMKAGCFKQISDTYAMPLIANNSNLFVSREKEVSFPGRAFSVIRTTSMNKKEISRALSGIKKANITVRNFPVTVAELRRRLKISDGGDKYIFATTTKSGAHVLLICEKIDG